ncbi:MAG: lipocalin family protein, partial [Alcanivoracaceae bacterium]|nr:lipocalin family protein [Alcanivoracaceae bacterium]
MGRRCSHIPTPEWRVQMVISMRWTARLVLCGWVLLLAGCTGVPEGIAPVQGFELPRYLGTWHEIARLDHSFERGMSQVTADYTLNEDGSVKVTNRGYLDDKG